MLSDLKVRLRALMRRDAVERDLDDELRFHLERETEKHIRAGMTRADAERRARLDFGGLERIKDDTRDARGIGVVDRVSQDLRYAVRALRARPGFTAAIVLTLGLGIGANAAMFGIVDRLLFRPPAYLAFPDRVHRVYVESHLPGHDNLDASIEYARYLDITRDTKSFDRSAVVGYRDLAVGTGENSREMRVAVASASFFSLFDVRPVIGRFYSTSEDTVPVGAPVAVLSYQMWQLNYGGSATVLGTAVLIEHTLYTIIGVAPERFIGITEEKAPALFIPVTTFGGTRRPTFYRDYGWSWLTMFVRRAPSVSMAAADADMTAAYRRSWDLERSQGNAWPTSAEARARAFAAPVQWARGPGADAASKVAVWVLGVATIVLLIACANVANLLLARAVSRRREIALRLALGVTRVRLIQQLLTESLLLAALGAIAGLAAAQWGGRVLRSLILRDAPGEAVFRDGRMLAFVGAAAIVVAILTGLAPGLQAIRADVTTALKAGAREGTQHRSRLRAALLLFQGAFSLVLLVGAGLFVRSLSHIRAERLGYDAERLVYAEGRDRGVQLSRTEQMAAFDRLMAAAASMPGVERVTPVISVPFWSSEGRGAPKVPGRDSLQRLGRFPLQAGSPDYFAATGTRILRGRGFASTDVAGSPPVVVVSAALARAVWPDRDAIGQIMRIGADSTAPMTVIGVAEDMRGLRIQGEPEMWYYLPIAQYIARFGEAYPSFMIRVSGRPADFVEPLRKRLQREMPGVSYIKTTALADLVAPQQRSWQFGATMFVAFGALALVLAAIGLYSVISYAVAQRTHELGVRIALGAGVGNVVGLVVQQAIRFALGGIVIGSIIALWAGRALQPLLYQQSPRDPVVFLAVAGVLLVVAVAATLRPALHATRVNPTEALRSD